MKNISKIQYLEALETIKQYHSQMISKTCLSPFAEMKTRRKKLKLSLRDVADLTGLSRTIIFNFENGKGDKNFNRTNLKIICDLYLSMEQIKMENICLKKERKKF